MKTYSTVFKSVFTPEKIKKVQDLEMIVMQSGNNNDDDDKGDDDNSRENDYDHEY